MRGRSPTTAGGCTGTGSRPCSRRSRPGRPARFAALTDLLVVATDVYTWKLLRRDRKLSQAQVERRLLRLVAAILDPGRRR